MAGRIAGRDTQSEAGGEIQEGRGRQAVSCTQVETGRQEEVGTQAGRHAVLGKDRQAGRQTGGRAGRGPVFQAGR